MASISTGALTLLWPPDDTEESILGVDRHQLDIFTLRGGINEEAHRLAGDGSLPWQAITQIMLLGCQRPDGSAYTVYPDVMVFPRPMSIDRGSYSLRQDGPPVLVIEVASDSTVESDLHLERGKAWSYAHAGVSEYLVLDPSRRFVPEIGRGWRLVDGAYQSWTPDVAGHWRSQAIPVGFGVENGLAAVFGLDGRRRLREGEIDAALEAERRIGLSVGTREALRRLARRRFGIDAALEDRIDAADEPEIEAMLDRLLTARQVDEV